MRWADFREAVRATRRLCRAAAAGTRLAGEIERHERLLATVRSRQREIELGFAKEAREQERLARELALLLPDVPERYVTERRIVEIHARLVHLKGQADHNWAELTEAEARYREITGAPFGSWLVKLSRGMTKPQGHVVQRAVGWLSVLELLVPRRLRQEEIGDALEIIHRLAIEGMPGWERCVRVKVFSTTFWVIVNAVRELAAGISGKKSA